MSDKTKKSSYEVLIPFPWRGHWTEKGQSLELAPVEAAQLLRSKKIKPSKGGAK